MRPVRHPGFQEFAVLQAAFGRRALAAVLTQRLLSSDWRIRQQAGAHRLARYNNNIIITALRSGVSSMCIVSLHLLGERSDAFFILTLIKTLVETSETINS